MSISRLFGLLATPRLRVWGMMMGLVLAGACSDSTTAPTSSFTHLRIMNALLQNTPEGAAVIRPIDYLFDSLVTAPSVMNLAANGMSVGDSANGYMTLPRGLHSYIARLAGDTTVMGMMYTSSANTPYVPRQRLISDQYYTILVTGIVPAFGPAPEGTVPFTILVDDPFPAPQFNGVYQARFKVVDAAPYANPLEDAQFGMVDVYVTPGNVSPSDPSVYGPMASTTYRGQTKYLNVDAGTYVLTLTSGTTGAIVAQQSVTFQAGDVCTFILRSTSDGEPSVANHILTRILDHRYGP